MARDEEIIEFTSAAELQDWLSRNYAASSGFWLKLTNNAAGEDVLTYAQALDVALCYGWIDGQKGKLDDAHWLQRFTPRSARSRWSKVRVFEKCRGGRVRLLSTGCDGLSTSVCG
ncbi:YdeI family protein [Streptomyces sp. NPDC086782]|uniref:YdeI/OmpD-associated family protein n=1 Tax=Streptomyces sp. NPDC086782 TaxID=3365757 RepID=UPI00381B5735